MTGRFFFWVFHPAGREYFDEAEIKKANAFAQRLANETGKPISRHDRNGGESVFYPAYGRGV